MTVPEGAKEGPPASSAWAVPPYAVAAASPPVGGPHSSSLTPILCLCPFLACFSFHLMPSLPTNLPQRLNSLVPALTQSAGELTFSSFAVTVRKSSS